MAKQVAPITGAWIETGLEVFNNFLIFWSPPSRGRGLKPTDYAYAWQDKRVAPITGAWIETRNGLKTVLYVKVAPITGAWIETKYVACAN